MSNSYKTAADALSKSFSASALMELIEEAIDKASSYGMEHCTVHFPAIMQLASDQDLPIGVASVFESFKSWGYNLTLVMDTPKSVHETRYYVSVQISWG